VASHRACTFAGAVLQAFTLLDFRCELLTFDEHIIGANEVPRSVRVFVVHNTSGVKEIGDCAHFQVRNIIQISNSINNPLDYPALSRSS
jgi:hypothetical protein